MRTNMQKVTGVTPEVASNISVVIVSWNCCKDLRECLLALKVQTIQGFEVIVIDNCSSDETVNMVRAEFPAVILRVTETNLGFAEGANRGIEISNGDWICTLNPDAVPAADWLAHIQSTIGDASETLGMIQSRIIFKETPRRINSAGISLLATGSGGDRGFNCEGNEFLQKEEIFAPSAGAAAYRRKMLWETRLESGFFDRTFFMYAEDLDLGWRGRLAGWTAIYLPECVVMHGYQRSSRLRGKNFANLQCRKNRVSALAKNASVPFLVLSIPKTVYDLFIGFRLIGFKIFPQFFDAARSGFAQRRSVSKLIKVNRREIESRWVEMAFRFPR